MHVFLDFEASSLGKDSYPIEVAWVFEDGRLESHLIRPLPAWTDWDERAAAIHGISRAHLQADGFPVDTLGRRLLDVLGGHEIYASSPSWDGKWLSVLLRGAGLPRHALRLRDTDEAQVEAAVAGLAAIPDPRQRQELAASIVARVRTANEGAAVAHRALPDAEHELRIWQEIGREAAEQAERWRAMNEERHAGG